MTPGLFDCHYEGRSDAAISLRSDRFAKYDYHADEIATLRSQ